MNKFWNFYFIQRLVEEDDEDATDTKTEDLIIDGQVQFGEDEEKPLILSASNSNDSTEFAEIISPDQIYVSGETDDTEFVDTDGVKLVRIRIADSDGKEQMAWVNVVSQEE